MNKFNKDQAIDGGLDKPDLLNRDGFSKKMAEILLLNSDDDCLTVSLEGEWGYGKTSVINLVKSALIKKEKSPIIIEYNPWLAGNSESLIQDFLLQFSSQLNIRDDSADALKAAEELIAYSTLFGVAKLVPGAEPWASIVEKILSRFGGATKKIAKLKELDLLGKKKKVVEAIKKIKTPIVVIIDDIDRLTPSETFQVLRLVKAVADFSGTSFLLAFDANYLSAVLDKNDIINSAEYINKVIQLRVPLPVISGRGMNKLANIELQKLSDKNLTDQFEKDSDRLSWIFHTYFKYLIKNPRELKRMFNHLRFVLEQVEGEVCFTDLFSLSIIATKANTIYEHIKEFPEAYIGRRFSNEELMMDGKGVDIVNSFDGERKEMLDKISKGDSRLISGLIGCMFPLIDSSDFSPVETLDTDAAGRISAAQRLYIAFHYKTPAEYVSDRDILDFISGSLNRPEFLDRVLRVGANERFFEMMINYSSKCKENSFEVLINIYDANLNSEALKISQKTTSSFMSWSSYRQMIWLTNKIISESPSNKYKLIKKIVGREENAPLSTDVLSTIRQQFSKNSHDDASWVSSAELHELEDLFQGVAINALSRKLFVDNHLESDVFYSLKRLSKEKASKYISDALDKDAGIIRVAEIIGNSGSDSSNGPYAQIDEKTLSDLVDLNVIREKASKIDTNEQPIHIQAIIKSINDGEKYYLKDGTKGDKW